MATAGGRGRMHPLAPDQTYWFIPRSGSLQEEVEHLWKTLLCFRQEAEFNTMLFLSWSFLASHKGRECFTEHPWAWDAVFPPDAQSAFLEDSQWGSRGDHLQARALIQQPHKRCQAKAAKKAASVALHEKSAVRFQPVGTGRRNPPNRENQSGDKPKQKGAIVATGSVGTADPGSWTSAALSATNMSLHEASRSVVLKVDPFQPLLDKQISSHQHVFVVQTLK